MNTMKVKFQISINGLLWSPQQILVLCPCATNSTVKTVHSKQPYAVSFPSQQSQISTSPSKAIQYTWYTISKSQSPNKKRCSILIHFLISRRTPCATFQTSLSWHHGQPTATIFPSEKATSFKNTNRTMETKKPTQWVPLLAC